jgi:hypothetical protein
MTIWEEADELKKLPRCVRLAKYMVASSKNAEIGSRLRTSKDDDKWTKEEEQEWEKSCENIEPLWISLDEEDKRILSKFHIEEFMAMLCCGDKI